MSSEISILNLILDSGAVAKTVIVVLLMFSIVTWAIMAERWRYFRRAQAQSGEFLAFFRAERNYRQVYATASKLPFSPAAAVYREVYEKYAPAFPAAAGQAGAADQSAGSAVQAATAVQADQAGRAMEVDQDLVESVYRDLRLAAHRELARFEQRLPLLATAGSVCPFLGLFGTVWGVMTAFLDISTQGSTNIVVVAPGIAEALITTIAGLAVAIPAMVAYNYFVQRSRVLGLELEDLATAVLNILQLRTTAGRP
ncbi:MAG: Tol-Pal system subunit TolQ [Gemmatimonadetes bacterium]|nr:Tol-Pal system subunit TolQ [Gemmatimonadota bacterium]MYK99727.1 Tol-Pal system subunit TolQ [Gemmatimonadota bacterium]